MCVQCLAYQSSLRYKAPRCYGNTNIALTGRKKSLNFLFHILEQAVTREITPEAIMRHLEGPDLHIPGSGFAMCHSLFMYQMAIRIIGLGIS